MDKQHLNFLLKYSKIGVLTSKENLDEIEFEELKQEYLKIKTELTDIMSQSIQSLPKVMEKINDTIPEGKDGSVVKKWFSGIGERQKKYQEDNKDKIV